MSTADFVVLEVRPHYSCIGTECPRVEGDDVYTSMISSLCFLVDCFDQEGTAQEPNMEMVDKYVHVWMLNKSMSPGFVEVEPLESLCMFVSQFDSHMAQNRLCDEIDLHGFLLFWMHLIDMSRHSGQEMACWGRGAAEHARQSQGSRVEILLFHSEGSLAVWNHSVKVPWSEMLSTPIALLACDILASISIESFSKLVIVEPTVGT
eukprot:scaffold59827_cov51-Attheya_sp.AAC.4